jgi:virulence factor Mce-like protein
MSGLSGRIGTNVVVVLVLSVMLVSGAFLTYASGVVFDDSYEVQVALPEAGGVLPDQQVTVMGRAVGQVSDVEVTGDGVLLTLSIQGDQRVPDPARATVLRRSPIGEQAVDLAPPEGDWQVAERDTVLATTDITIAPEVVGLLEKTVDLFSTIEPTDVTILVEELAVALDGRGDRLTRLGRDSRDLQRTLVGGIPEFERLLDTSEATLAVLRDQRDTIRSVIREGADLTEVFAEQRPNLDALLDGATPALDQAETLLLNTSSNFGCLMGDLTDLNRMLLGPSTYAGANGPDLYASKLDELERGLAGHQFFFQQGFSLVAQPDRHTGQLWLRVLLSADSPQTAEFYPELRPTPATTPGAACDSEAFGPGADAVRQPGVQEAHETAPPIDYAPARGADAERATPPERDDAERGSSEVPPPADTGELGTETADTEDGAEPPVELQAGPTGGEPPSDGGGADVAAVLLAMAGLAALGWLASRIRRLRSGD